MSTLTFTPQIDTATQDAAFSALADLAFSRPSAPADAPAQGAPWMTHSAFCRCTLCR